MKKIHLMISLIFCLSLCVGCDEPIELVKNGKVLLGDKYVDATTDFTDEEAINVLKSVVWCDKGIPYIYDDKLMIYADVEDWTYDIYWYKFFDNGIFDWSPELSGLDNPKFEYSVENRILTLRYVYRDILGSIYSERVVKVNLIAVDKNRIIFDSNGVSEDYSKYYPEIDYKKAKTRTVWTAKK